MVSDLVSGVLTRLAELETAAKRALAGYPSIDDNYDMESAYMTRVWQARYHEVTAVMTREPSERQMSVLLPGVNPRREKVADCGPANIYPAKHIAMNDPQAVLRLCRAHRQIVERYQVAAAKPDELMAQRAHGMDVLIADGVAKALLADVRDLAVGLGVVEEEDR